jgi:4-methyl-5(b-hydroxyethyl)-thiazole monophosphate biosynthesis
MRALIVVPEEFGEIETFTILNILKKADIHVTMASMASSIVMGSSRTRILSDKKLSEADANSYDILVLPGGPGYKNLLHSLDVLNLVKNFNKQNKIIVAIGESPIVLAEAGIIDDKIATVFPGHEKKIPRIRDARVVIAKNVLTARSSSAAADLALKLVEAVTSKQVAQKVRRSIDGSA